jgi:hypothetical protein
MTKKIVCYGMDILFIINVAYETHQTKPMYTSKVLCLLRFELRVL